MSKSWGEIREEALRRCGQKPPLTNADKIRAMTDEELAHFMMRTTDCPCVARANGCCRSDISCQKAWLDRLKQEAEA